MTTAPAPLRRSHGFTLIELLLAMMIFAVVLTAVNGVFFGAMRLWKKTSDVAQRALPVQQTFAALRRDLTGIVVPGGTFAGVLNSSATIQGLNQQDVATEFFTNSGRRLANVPWGDLQAVAYVLRDPTNRTELAGRDLVRIVRRNLLPVLQVEAEEQHLMSGVERIDFSFYDGSSWRTSWNSTNELSPLPTAVKVEIVVAPEPVEAGRVRPSTHALAPLQLVVPILVAAGTNSTTASTTGGGL